MPANKLVDVYCQGYERVGNSIFFTLEIDDLPDPEEAEEMIKTRLSLGDKKVRIWDLAYIAFYINRINRKIREVGRLIKKGV